MNPLLIAQILEALASAATTAYSLYEQGKDTLSTSDAKLVHDALLKAQLATDEMRAKVDAALTAAAENK